MQCSLHSRPIIISAVALSCPPNRNCDPTPDSLARVIAVCCELFGTPVAIRFGLVSVLVDHQHCDTPDVDLPYHTGKNSSVMFRIACRGKRQWPNPHWSGSSSRKIQPRNSPFPATCSHCVQTPIRSGLWGPSTFSDRPSWRTCRYQRRTFGSRRPVEISHSDRSPNRLRLSGCLTIGTPLGQRARSRETLSSNRPRVGPLRSPASSSGVPRSRIVACARYSRTSEPIRPSHAV